MPWATYAATLAVYAGSYSCNNASNPTASFPTQAVPTASPLACFPIGGGLYAQLPSTCNIENNAKGTDVLFYTGPSCSSGTIVNPSALPPDVLAYGASGYRGYGFCATADLPSQGLLSYVVKCQATPCCSSSGWIVTLSIILSFTVIGLVGYWVWADRQAILKKKRDQTALAASIADASAKAAKVVGSATSTDSVHGGYNSL